VVIRRLLAVFFAVALAVPAVAEAPDPRGWSPGTPAATAARVLSALPKHVELDFPSDFAKQITGPTLLVYFSPTCPHCQAAAPELVALSGRLAGSATVIGVASGHSSDQDIAMFRVMYHIPFALVKDADGKIGTALGVQSTPSAALVAPSGKKFEVVDFWYPYLRGDDTLVLMRALADPWKAFAPGEYVGNEACAACHSDEYDSWGLTAHSIAWKTLLNHQSTDDPACVSCHVTGNGQPTGWNGEAESTLVNVGCEACHGPGGPHDGTRQDAKDACASCHDPMHTIAFSFAKGLPLIDHYKAADMPDEQFTAARKALLGGDVPRSLLAFQAGTNVGVDACASCHPTEVASWKASPHAGAMAQLGPDDAAKAECVACHATPTASGPRPTDVIGYRVAESVGCESCHGPADSHVASPTKDNIEGLGDDCPVCVVEAVCTSCHTTQWDPSWDLDKKLPLAAHAKP
jgi:thiol-disulfide isomerase/thioredoxin